MVVDTEGTVMVAAGGVVVVEGGTFLIKAAIRPSREMGLTCDMGEKSRKGYSGREKLRIPMIYQ